MHDNATRTKRGQLLHVWNESRQFLLFVVLMLVFRSAFADWNSVPTGSMQPTIVEGDRILVNKMAYDLRVPFTHISVLRLSEPQRGDIVVFDSHVSSKRLVKRIVGVPGDVVELRRNRLRINGEALNYIDTASTGLTVDRTEDLVGVEHQVRIAKRGSAVSNFSPLRIPEDFYLALGDNRDNSADSRVIGLVPRSEIVGRTRKVAFSVDYENFYLPRRDRFLHTL